ncbi:MAG: chemotaxis protein CheW [bacterium]
MTERPPSTAEVIDKYVDTLVTAPKTARKAAEDMELQTERGKVNIGTIVDEVAEVMDFEENSIDNASGFGTFLDSAFILGVGIVKGGVKILLDIDKVLTTKEVKTMATLAQN